MPAYSKYGWHFRFDSRKMTTKSKKVFQWNKSTQKTLLLAAGF